jgi:hypothetical protein
VIAAGSRGPVVVDTDVFSADLVPGSWLVARRAVRGDHHRPTRVRFVPDDRGAALRRAKPWLGTWGVGSRCEANRIVVGA